MKVSVSMPAYNAERYLEPTTESVLAQTHRDFDFVIVNDGSMDGSAEILGHYAKHDSRITATAHPAKLGKLVCGGGNSAILGGAEGIKYSCFARYLGNAG